MVYAYKVTVLVAIAVTVILSPLVSQAEIYKWTDENGKVHFSDKPVGEKSKTFDVKVKPSTPVSAKSRDERKQRAEGFMRARQEEREERNKKIAAKKKLKALRKVNCKKAKKEYNEFSRARAVYYKNKDGTRDYLDPARMKKENTKMKADIKKWCK